MVSSDFSYLGMGVQLPRIDAVRIAKRVVEMLKPTAGERAILVHDPTYYPELTQLIYTELSGAGVHPIVALTFEPPETTGAGVANPIEAARVLATDPARAKKREAEVVAMLLPMFERADIFFWLPARNSWPDLRWERLVGATRARGIHFHWISAPDSRNSEELQMLTRSTNVLFSTLITRCFRKNKINSSTHCKARTYVSRFRKARTCECECRTAQYFTRTMAICHSSARGRLDQSGTGRWKFPSGHFASSQIPSLLKGGCTSSCPTRHGIAEGVSIQFEQGRAVRIAARKNEAGFRAEWDGVGGDIDKVGEIVIGTNPLLIGTPPSGELPYFGYGAGYLRVSLGENWESGGTNRSPLSRPLWFLLEQATLETGSRSLIRAGQLVN